MPEQDMTAPSACQVRNRSCETPAPPPGRIRRGASSGWNLDDILLNTRRDRVPVVAQALQVELHGFPDVLVCLDSGPALGDAPRERGTRGHEHPVLILLDVHTELHGWSHPSTRAAGERRLSVPLPRRCGTQCRRLQRVDIKPCGQASACRLQMHELSCGASSQLAPGPLDRLFPAWRGAGGAAGPRPRGRNGGCLRACTGSVADHVRGESSSFRFVIFSHATERIGFTQRGRALCGGVKRAGIGDRPGGYLRACHGIGRQRAPF